MKAARSIRRPAQAEQTVGQRRSQVDDARRAAVQTGDPGLGRRCSRRAPRSPRSRPAVRAAQIALDGTQQEALVGSRTVLDVLISEQQLFTTQSQLVDRRSTTRRSPSSTSPRRSAG